MFIMAFFYLHYSLDGLDLMMLEDALNNRKVYSAGWLSRTLNKAKGALQKGCSYVNGKSLKELSMFIQIDCSLGSSVVG